MKTKIICKELRRGELTFYAIVDGKEYFLFHQEFKKTVYDYFRTGVSVSLVNNYSIAHSHTVRKLLDKLPAFLHYIEKEYGVEIYEKTKKSNDYKRAKAYKREPFRWQDYAWAV